MTTLAIHRENSSIAVPLPAPRDGAIAVRLATVADLPFIDALHRGIK